MTNLCYYSINAFELSLNEKEEICVTRKKLSSDKCPGFLKEVKALLSEMKDEIARVNIELMEIKKNLNKTESCGNEGCISKFIILF